MARNVHALPVTCSHNHYLTMLSFVQKRYVAGGNCSHSNISLLLFALFSYAISLCCVILFVFELKWNQCGSFLYHFDLIDGRVHPHRPLLLNFPLVNTFCLFFYRINCCYLILSVRRFDIFFWWYVVNLFPISCVAEKIGLFERKYCIYVIANHSFFDKT